MKGSIIDTKEERRFVYMQNIFSSINNIQVDYNWLITNCECFSKTADSAVFYNNTEYTWISGEELTEIVNKDDFYWIWGVFSGFKKNIKLEEVLKHKLPYADGYTGFWKPELSIQHPLAEIEIVEWDSTLALIISKENKIAEDFKNYFPLAEDLQEYNKK